MFVFFSVLGGISFCYLCLNTCCMDCLMMQANSFVRIVSIYSFVVTVVHEIKKYTTE